MQKQTKSSAFYKGWQIIAKTWNYGTPPSRPSSEDTKHYKRFVDKALSKKPKIKVLLLGATPEIRDMLSSYGQRVSVVIVDINIEMIMAMSSLMRNPNPNEVIIRSNWINTPLMHNFFDLTFGDAVLHNVPGNLQDDFLQHQNHLLNKNGIFVSRVAIHNSQKIKKIKNTQQVFEEFLRNPGNKWGATELALTLYFISTKNGLMSISNVKQYLRKYLELKKQRFSTGNKTIDRWLNNPFNAGWWGVDKKWYVNDKVDTEQLLKKYFIIKEVFDSGDIKKHSIYKLIGSYLPFYVLSPKK